MLAVLSPDPPITEAEIVYLQQIRAHAPSILPVISKIDLVAGEDRRDMIDYRGRVLARLGIT